MKFLTIKNILNHTIIFLELQNLADMQFMLKSEQKVEDYHNI